MSFLRTAISSKKISAGFRKGVNTLRHQLEDRIRLSQLSSDSSPIVNDKEIRVVGLRRTGNHAIMNWIRKQQRGEIFYINNALINVNPYRDVYEEQVRIAKKPDISGWRTDNLEKWKKEALGDFSYKDCLVYSYEDQPMEKMCDPAFEKKHDIYFGKSRIRYDLILLRDPFNLFASRLRASRRKNPTAGSIDFMKVKSRHHTLPQLWIDYAKEYLNETNYLSNVKVPVNYNQWVNDSAYRRQLAETLGLEFTDSGVDDVMTNGGGSSFDGTNLQGKATEMSVLERWTHFSDDAEFKALIADKSLRDYCTEIFGTIPGTESLYTSST
ncbi:hypothetical protein S7335_1961 [Synechococcus sp. PCC 7335]|uniref:hypothetical protein n=1 Tax=Synechococcus sp. (strain ATCC 29403 / PCC 7335) TaxID=91464 RepID=UPI00017ED998|nr:hypothetical protein [Synechococcus sp. PCC 7335]EDX84264.1 hypothetical protein S7335_1961 [Synechococcus sp. PCC 7335]